MIRVFRKQKLYKEYMNKDMDNILDIIEIYLDIGKYNKLKVFEVPNEADCKLMANLRLN